jgi:Flp pilus assembly protein TadD
MAVRCVAAFTFIAHAAIASAQDDPNEIYRQGMRLFAEHKPDAAIAAFERVIALRPKNAAAWKALGVVYAAQRNFGAAENPLRTACELNPALPDACLYYGRTLYLLNRFQPAIDVLRRALANDRENAEIHRLLGLSLEGLGATEEAGVAFRNAVRLLRGSPPNEDPGIDYGVYLFRLGSAEEAVAPIEAALARHPDAARAHLELGCVLLSLDRLQDAESHLERASALDPESSRTHLLLGKVYLRLGKTKAGEEQLSQGSRTVK